jgi:hypothetical protein
VHRVQMKVVMRENLDAIPAVIEYYKPNIG